MITEIDRAEEVREIESVILRKVERLGSCKLDDLVRALPHYTWTQVFVVIDRLSRNGELILRHPGGFEYIVEARVRRVS